MVFLLVVLTVLLLVVVDYLLHRRETSSVAVQKAAPAKPSRGEPPPEDVAPGVFVGPGHTWLRLERTGEVTLGADRFPSLLLGDPDRISVPSARSDVRRGEPFVELHGRDRTLRLAAPVDGTVVAVNPKVTADPSRIAADPFGEGWLVKLTPRNLGARLKDLFVAEEAAGWMRQELRRLRDTLTLLTGRALTPQAASLPDGGLPIRGLAAALSPDDWETLHAQLFTVEVP